MNQWALDNSALIAMISAFGMILLTLVYVVFTILIQAANKKVVEQNEVIRKENKMPNVIVHFDMTIFNILDLKVKNIGTGVAMNIKASIEEINEIVNVNYLKNFSLFDGIAFLAPNQSLKTMVGSLLELKNSKGEYPIYKVSLTYSDTSEEEYSTTYIINANMYRGNVQIVDKTIHDLTNETGKIKEELEKINRSFQEMIKSNSGL